MYGWKNMVTKMPRQSYSSGSYEGIALLAPVSFGYERFSDHGASWFIGNTLAQMLKQANLSKADVDGLAVSSFSMAPDSVVCLAEHFGMTLSYLEQLPYGGSSGVIALRKAARAVQAGDAEIVACIGGDTNKQHGFKTLVANFSRFSSQSVYPYGAAGPNMPFSLITRHYMDNYGATREDFGRIAVAQRYNASRYEQALMGAKPLDMDSYLKARPIAGPIHLFDCVMPCAGGEGLLLMPVERARKTGLPWARILAAGECHNAFSDDAVQYRAGWSLYADSLYEQASVASSDIDILQTYDDYPVISMLQMEGLGFCKQGEAAKFVRETPLTFDGNGLPHNTSGGQLSAGQAGAAGGFLGLVESVRQLNGTAERNQVENARTAMVSGYGMINYDRGLCSSAAILQKGNA